ncbi:MAG: 1-phosphofructokinase family hexose kinase [Ndongobacter sp.]|nr:1-phosphofructokinase family hexose kinase [Ndongobacter sp.]
MIYTVTLNPSLDFHSELSELRRGRINYSSEDHMYAGGRAINVSRVLRILGLPTMATGFLGGKTGAFIEEELDRCDIPNDFVHVEGMTRINLNLFADHVETRIIGAGPNISINEINELMYYISRVREGDFVIMGGSLPPNVSSNVYDRIIEICIVNKAQFIPIIPTDLLFHVFPKKPLIVAPTLVELSSIFDVRLTSLEEAIPYAMKCVEAGAQNIIVSSDRLGSILVTSDGQVLQASGPDGAIISSTSTNVSLIAGFIGSYMRTNDPVQSFRHGQAASNAAHLSRALPTREQIDDAYRAVEVLPLS